MTVGSVTIYRFLLKEASLVLMLCAPVFIFTSGSSALIGRPRWGLSIWLSLLALFNTFSEFMPIFFTRKRTKHENTRSPPYSYDAEGYEARKALILREPL